MNGNPDVAADAARTVTMNQFEGGVALRFGRGDFPIEFGEMPVGTEPSSQKRGTAVSDRPAPPFPGGEDCGGEEADAQ